MMLRNETSAPIPPRQPSRAGAIVGRWLVILLFAGVVGCAVWQYRENQRLAFELAEAREDLASSTSQLGLQEAMTESLTAKLNELTDASRSLLATVERKASLDRRVAAASAQYYHASTARTVSAPAYTAPAVRTPAPRAVPTPQPRHQPASYVAAPAGPPVERIQSALKTRIDRHYKAQRNTGSGSTLVFEVEAEYGEPREIPGWAGRYEVKGEVWYQYYDSIWGGSFSRGTGSFTAEVKVTGSRVEIVDFSAR